VGNHQLSRGSSTYTTRPAGYPSGEEPPAVERQLHLHHTPSRVPQRWSTTSCREAAPLTPHAQPGTPAVGYHQLSRDSSTYTTRPAGYPRGGVPPAVERQLPLTDLLCRARGGRGVAPAAACPASTLAAVATAAAPPPSPAPLVVVAAPSPARQSLSQAEQQAERGRATRRPSAFAALSDALLRTKKSRIAKR
jgi:hypothetical protein